MDPDDRIPLGEAAARLGYDPSQGSYWRRTDRRFPPVTPRGRALLVSWSAVVRWHEARQRDMDRQAEFSAERRALIEALRREAGASMADARWLVAECEDVSALRRVARRMNLRTVRG